MSVTRWKEITQKIFASAYSAEAGSAWSLIHPEYTVAIPYPDVLEVPLAYGIKKNDIVFKNYMDTWIELKKKDKTIESLYDHCRIIEGNEFAFARVGKV